MCHSTLTGQQAEQTYRRMEEGREGREGERDGGSGEGQREGGREGQGREKEFEGKEGGGVELEREIVEENDKE